MKKMEEATLLKVKKWVKIVSYVTGSLSIVLTPLLFMYVEWVPKIRAANGEAEVSYEAMAPAVVEIQGILKKGREWGLSVDERISALEEEKSQLDRRVMACEIYMDLVSKKKGMPDAPKPEPTPDAILTGPPDARIEPPMVVMSMDPDGIEDEPPMAQGAPRYQVQTKFKDAKKMVKERKRLDCAVNDPLCGALE